MIKIARTSLAALALSAALGLPVAGPVPSALAAPSCSATEGQALIDQGRYDRAIREFGCVIDAAPTEAEGYRGRAEAELLLGRYSDAFRDYTRITAFVEPLQPAVMSSIHDAYLARLDVAPDDIPALTGASFARWYDFAYAQATHLLNHLLDVRPSDAFGYLFRGSSRLLNGGPKDLGAADLELAITLAPASPDVRFIVADAYTYGLSDPDRAFAEASLALEWGLDTPRVHALLAAALNAFGEVQAAAAHIARHLELVTTELVPAAPLGVGGDASLAVVPGRVFDIPLVASAGEAISIVTSSRDYWDSIGVLLAPDGTPVAGSDDDSGYHVAIEWVPPTSGTYHLRVTFFEAVNTGQLVVSRD